MMKLPERMHFHQLSHTQNVFLAATEMALFNSLPHQDILTLQLAAIFHDTGYIYTYTGHEEQSKLIAANWLLKKDCDVMLIDAVTEAIEGTIMPQSPKDDIQRILCDADLFHLSQTDYIMYADCLRREWLAHLDKEFTDAEWYQSNIAFLQQHQYFTAYGKELLETGKQKNIQLLQDLLAAAQ